jgi:hypothetical protein
MIKINIDKAKEIQKDKIRSVRKPLLEKLDAEFVRALEFDKDSTTIKEQKQALRDITTIVSETEIAGTTVDEITKEIKEIWNEDLLGPNPETNN